MSNKGLCNLCVEGEANQTGSHIFTYSWIKMAINEAGQTKRDKEITFSIDSFNLVGSYFGRGVQPEKIEEVLKREMTDEEIENNTNYFTIDNIVCKECEKRFTTAENYFNDNLHAPIKENKLKKEADKNGNEIIKMDEKDINIDIIRLNILIQIWRASVSKYEGFMLKPKLEEKLRKIIHSNLEIDLEKTVANCKKHSNQIRGIPIIITFVETEIKSKNSIELTTNIVFVGKGNIPYFFALNNIYIQLYEKESHLKSTIQHLFGINNIIDRFEHVNHNEKELKIGVLNETNRMKILTNFGEHVANKTLHTLSSFFSRSYKSIFGFKPTREILEVALNEVIYNAETNDSDRYTAQNVFKSFAKVMYESIGK